MPYTAKTDFTLINSDSSVVMGGATGTAGMISNLAGLNTSGLLEVTKNADGSVTRSINKGAAANTAMQVVSAAAGGLATFSVAAGPGGAIAGVAMGMLSAAVSGGMNAHDARKAIPKLEGIKMAAAANHLDDMVGQIEWLISKQERKFGYGVANATGVAQPFTTLTRAFRAGKKFANGTKGVARADAADYFYDCATGKRGQAAEQALAVEVIGVITAMGAEDMAKQALAEAFKS